MLPLSEIAEPHARAFAIGDIHGCSIALRALIEAIDPKPNDLIISLGDFIDYGPDSRGVVEQLIALTERCQFVPIMGNHEEMLLAALNSPSNRRFWLDCGGVPTLKSYEADDGSGELTLASHIEFIARCRPYLETETHIFVHANYDPELPMKKLNAEKLRWDFLKPTRQRPHCSGRTVVVGHTPQTTGMPLNLGFLIGIDTDCSRGGWLTALEAGSGTFLQANQHGETRVLFSSR